MAANSYARPETLVDSGWLEQRLHDPRVRIVEVDVSPAAYTEGHIPGATLWNVYKDLKDASYQLVDRDGLQGIVRRSGIRPDSTVVLYGYAPAMGFWLLKLFGHADVRILNMSRTAWQEEGHPWTADPSGPAESDYVLPEEDSRLRALQPLMESAIGDPKRVLLDVRTEAEFRGERFWPSGAMQDGGRAGHIPTAAHVPIDGVQDERGAFRPRAELEQHFAAAGAAPEQEILTYCTIGGRASTAWFVLTQLLGHEQARVYDGSWAEWGQLPAAPVEQS